MNDLPHHALQKTLTKLDIYPFYAFAQLRY